MTDVAITEALGQSLSPSRVKTYLTCSAKWYFRYLIGLSEPTTGTTTLGKAFHGTLARSFRQKLSTATLNYLEQLVPTADAMPEVNCGFAPTAGKFEGVRTGRYELYAFRSADHMRAVIIGAGIGGLAAAVALRRIGVEPLVIERVASIREVGAGISIWSNAVNALRERLNQAILRASITSSRPISARIDQRTTGRLNRSRTTARNSSPSSVGM